jgi:hypothetical protein
MMIDLTSSEETALTAFVEGAIASDHEPPSPRIRTLDALVAELEQPPTVAVALLLAAGPDDRPRRKPKR